MINEVDKKEIKKPNNQVKTSRSEAERDFNDLFPKREEDQDLGVFQKVYTNLNNHQKVRTGRH